MSLIASTKVSGRGLSFFANRELTSVLAPGLFIIAELTYLILRISSPSSTIRVLAYFKGLSGTVGILLLLVASAIGYVVGYVVRELAFRFLGLLEKIPAIGRELMTVSNDRLVEYFDEPLIAQCLDAHPFLHAKLRPAETSQEAARYRIVGGGNIETPDYESFVYAKLWIRNFSYGFSVDATELEINVLAAALVPSLLLAADILVSVRLTWWAVLLTVIILAMAWWILLNSLFRLRGSERWEAVRNLILDYTMRAAAESYPLSARAEEAPEPDQL